MASRRPAAEVADPVDYYLEDMEMHGRAERTRDAYERVLRGFAEFLDGRSTDPGAAGHRDCLAWVHSLRADLSPSTVATYATTVNRFYDYMTRVGAFDENPMALVMEEMDESIEKDPERRDVDVATMGRFLGRITHPLHHAVVLTLLKTGMRVGELCNLDCRDLRLSNPGLSEYGLDGRPQLDGRGDAIYVDSEPARGGEYNGEVREESNKRKRSTVVPVDDELRRGLRRWLAIRPDSLSPAEPLFVSTADDWGERLTARAIRHYVREYAEEMGWYEAGAGAGENVTPHYFRHFFTTHLRDRTGDRGVVKYLRGDVASDVIDTYTHNWGDQVRETYLSNIYRFD
ncbi:tyrosine-type recombinase/integrase [Halolamina sp. CBA1230]|uniref:tyrosine-type recombinase/integrase n=1 Tax=Halolamina sp. CBA1230 TaxID=1853690 RepID=UPI0009A15D85|nr:tyrosine-type recombinase/integrase [Halolamina sp. CBA1230]QKY19522.1 tyrosine-type recombinase/integrase [Halolamina sp. CBA1230]